MPVKRTYDDSCGIARALDLVGERWALLVMRELMLGPKRFSDLQRGLPTASQNVLSHRLRELTAAGVVRRRKLGAPVGAWVYEPTPWGRELEPVLLALGRWGSRAPMVADAELNADAMVLGLKSMFLPEAAAGVRVSLGLRLGDEVFRLTIADGRLEAARGDAERPDAVVATDVATLRELIFRGRPTATLRASGRLTVEGDVEAVERLPALFARPRPAPEAEADEARLSP
ncbi:winged helix-turn-helix transcriptional regulator [Thermomonospora umbrina]|uniref:HxlR family transcriptional regulator n=1 Tax=Thermomonospora umbrina TaxID=111806 RepID=A0A3D9SG13_9ACTN|nr:winged helix-turn-helix transcriptional regulator [Thermomonospora umbrina]REE94846.1 HxlR family transcriptional regulator [Thermomonospora umbrina]